MVVHGLFSSREMIALNKLILYYVPVNQVILSCNFISKVPTHHSPSRHLIIIKMLARENAVAVALTGADVSVVANNNKCIVNYSVLLKKENKITTKKQNLNPPTYTMEVSSGLMFHGMHSFIHTPYNNIVSAIYDS